MTDDNPVGTPYYLAPEIWREKKYSKESDIWALGVILYELLHYKKPFPANDKDELIEKVYNKPFNKIRSGISTPLQHLINIMLKKDPTKRPSIEEIIMSDEFQNITSKQRINLPLQLNKQKILQKIATDQLGDLTLTPF
jgi:serine/threonine protein kinase